MLRGVRARVTTTTGAIARGLTLLAIACAKETPPPPASDAAAQIAATLFAPKPRGPAVIVEVAWAGHGTLEVEREVVLPIEAALAGAVEAEELESIASPGRARIYVTAPSDADPFELMKVLRDAIPLRELPTDIDAPVLTRADRDGRVLFAMMDRTMPSRMLASDNDELDRLADEVARQPGVWNVRRCGQTRRTGVIHIDPSRVGAFGIGLDQVIDWLATELPKRDGIDGMMEAFSTPIGGTLRLADIASMSTENREGACVVLGPMGLRPTLEIWASEPGLAAARKVLDADKQAARLRMWTVGDPTTPTAIVASTLAPRDQNTIMMLWLTDDRTTPSWVVRNGDDPGWLLTEETTMLRSFSRARLVELHTWWPGAPIPVAARICGPELDTLVTTADTLQRAMAEDELLDDVVAWAPRSRAATRFTIDREKAAARGVPARAIAQLGQLANKEDLVLSTHVPIVVRMDPTDAREIAIRTSSGPASLADIGETRDVGEPDLVQRFDRQRCATVDMQPRREEDRGKIEKAVKERAVLPTGVTLTFAEL